jgi:hypothetical protein
MRHNTPFCQKGDRWSVAQITTLSSRWRLAPAKRAFVTAA